MQQDDGVSRRKLLQQSALVVTAAATLVGASAAGDEAMSQTEDKSMPKYSGWQIEKKNQVATIRKLPFVKGGHSDNEGEIGEIFSNMRGDDSVRVIVLTGEGNGIFGVPPYAFAPVGNPAAQPNGPYLWKATLGLVRAYEAMFAIEKPIVAKVNGDAVGFFHNLVWASDFIVAQEDAVLGDHHLAGVKVPHAPNLIEYNSTPGDGGAAVLPLHLPPTQAKECLMLGKTHTGKQLADMGVINYAVPADQLDRVTDDIVQRLLQRSAHALAWSKRVINQHYTDRMTRVLNSGIAYELVDIYQLASNGGKIPTKL